MEDNKKNLILSSIFMIIYVIINFVYLYKDSKLITDDIISNIIVFVLSIVGIIYFLFLTKENIDLDKHHKGILFFSIVFFIFNIISGIFGFILYGNLNKTKKEKRDLPIIEYQEFTNKYICLIVFFISLYLIMIPEISKISHMIILYIFIMFLMIIVFRKQLVHDFKIFKEYFKEYMSLTLKTWCKALVVMAILSLTIQIITGQENSNNQQNLQTVFNQIPIVMGLITVIYAPLVEELMFRGVFRKFLKNKYLFIILSGVIFGLMHVIDDSKTLAEYSYVLVYSALGIYIASLYYKTNNLFTNITFHFIQNSLAVIGMIILKFLG